LHVHSQISDGAYSIQELAALAQQRGIDVLGISDSFLTRASYGLPPFRKLVSRTISRPGVLDFGIDSYFNVIQTAQNAVPDVLLLPGVEVTPNYYWLGSWPGQLELHDFDRHLLVWGITDATVLRNLPVVQNEHWVNTHHDWWSAAGPAATWLGGILLLAIALAARKARPLLIAGPLFLLALCWTYDAYPFGRLADPYSGKPNIAAAQRLIDEVADHGGLTYWSYPEAKYPDVSISGSKMVSRAQPQVLGMTQNYRGFEGLYGDTITITKPGALWDQLLGEYVRGERKDWPSVITGIDFHSFKPGNGWYALDRGLSILFARNKTIAEVISALRQGRGYATFQNSADHVLLLENYALQAAEGEAISGETVRGAGEVDLSFALRWSPIEAGSPSDRSGEIRIIQDGQLIDETGTVLPTTVHRRLHLDRGAHYVRVMIETGLTRILSNPIFCDARSDRAQ
jgi:hypothetical protein